jgi:hypothetical protein
MQATLVVGGLVGALITQVNASCSLGGSKLVAAAAPRKQAIGRTHDCTERHSRRAYTTCPSCDVDRRRSRVGGVQGFDRVAGTLQTAHRWLI